MQITVKPGTYIVAVSGGVDSMVLLDLLCQRSDIKLIVAHYEHGIREDSDQDRRLVEEAAATRDLTFIYEHGELGSGASEALAREHRYAFLRRAREQYNAQGIITAHHQDDLIETAIINLLRGTGRKGLSSLRSTDELLRPLLDYSKKQIIAYAVEHAITWHEDSTNGNEAYLRNYIRQSIVPKLGQKGRKSLLDYINKAADINPVIDDLLLHHLGKQQAAGSINRKWFIMLPYDVSCEVMAAWLRSNTITEFDKRAINRLVVAAKVAMPGKVIEVNTGYKLKVGKTTLQLSEELLS